jgi:hypothetical protein
MSPAWHLAGIGERPIPRVGRWPEVAPGEGSTFDHTQSLASHPCGLAIRRRHLRTQEAHDEVPTAPILQVIRDSGWNMVRAVHMALVRVIGVTTAVFGVASVVAIIVIVQRTSVC